MTTRVKSPMSLAARVLSISLAGLPLQMIPSAAWSQSAAYPSGPIKVIIPAPPGGMSDTVGRIVAEELRKKFNQTVVVENQSGASGMIAAQNLARSKPDGQTIGIGYTAFLTAPIVSTSDAKYDPVKDFSPISQLADSVGIILVKADSPYKSWDELRQAKLKSGRELSFGVPGYGSTPHFYGKAIAEKTGMEINIVPYRGEAAIVADLLGGTIESAVLTPAAARALIAEGRLVPLAVTNPRRTPVLPDVPTIGQLGLPTLGDASTWVGVFAPAGTPQNIVSELSGVMQDMMKNPAIRDRFIDQFGLTPIGSTDIDFKDMLERDFKNWSLARDAYQISAD